MKKISVSNLVTYHRKSEKSKKTFLKNLAKEKVKVEGKEGGDYWVRSISGLSHAFRDNNNVHIQNKIADILGDVEVTPHKTVKDKYFRNIAILKKYQDFNFGSLYPQGGIRIVDDVPKRVIIQIQNLPIQVHPNHIFIFKSKGIQYVGAIWFVAKKETEAYKNNELGMFAECLYQYLKTNFKDKYELNPKYCIIMDVINMTEVNYQMIESGGIPRLLRSTLNSIKQNM